jgi:hypothetical protein
MSHDSKVEEMDATQYWRIVGSMRYLIHTHPEGICCRVCEPLPPSCEENPPLHRWDTRVWSTLWGRTRAARLLGYCDSDLVNDIGPDHFTEAQGYQGFVFYFLD